MTENRFTPGPWVATQPDDFGDITINRGPDDPLAIAAVVNGEFRRMGGKSDEHTANAHLIAAAPDEDEALGECLTLLKVLTGPDDELAQAVIQKAERARAKARGETP